MSETRADRPTDANGRQLEADARAEASVGLEGLEATPLEFGAHIAWSECLMGRTNGFSAVHRVGLPQFAHAYTTCGELVPAPVTWIPLSPAMIRTMPRCKFCEAEHARVARERAA